MRTEKGGVVTTAKGVQRGGGGVVVPLVGFCTSVAQV